MVTSVPSREIESKSVGASKVTPSQMTEEDRLRLFGKTPTEEAFIEGIKAGKTIPQLEKEWRMKPNTLYTLVKKWGLTGIVTTIKQDKPQNETTATPSDKGSDHMDPKFKLSKEEYLLKRVGGMTRMEISKNHEVAYANLLNYWLKKWGIKDELQEEIAMQEVIAKAASEAKDKSFLGFSQSDSVSDLVNTITKDSFQEKANEKADDNPPSDTINAINNNSDKQTEDKGPEVPPVTLPPELTEKQPALRVIRFEIPINSSPTARSNVYSLLEKFSDEIEDAHLDYRKALLQLLELAANYVTLLHGQMEQFIVEGDPLDYLDKFIRKHNLQYITNIQEISK